MKCKNKIIRIEWEIRGLFYLKQVKMLLTYTNAAVPHHC